MPNVKSKINAHNKKILSSEVRKEERTCNCTRIENCPLNQNCLSRNIVYEATLTSNLPNYGEKSTQDSVIKVDSRATNQPST